MKTRKLRYNVPRKPATIINYLRPLVPSQGMKRGIIENAQRTGDERQLVEISWGEEEDVACARACAYI